MKYVSVLNNSKAKPKQNAYSKIPKQRILS